MKDRQPTQVLANGAIRYGVYNADGTLDRYEYLKREDAPTVEGTPLNKANLLSDATAQKIWPDEETRPEDPTVNEALIELRKGSTKIGDILMTARAKPSDAWLLCNGQSISQADYPELFALLRSKAGPGEWTTKDVAGIDRATLSVNYANSKWFAFAYQRRISTAYNESGTLYVYVSEDTDTWSCYAFEVSVPGSLSNQVYSMRAAICYSAADGMYYLVVEWENESYCYYYAYSMQPDFSTLQEKSNVGSAQVGYQPDIYKLYATVDGTLYYITIRWITGSGIYYASTTVYASSDHAATWTTTSVDYQGSTSIYGIDYDPILDKFIRVAEKEVYIGSTPQAGGDTVLIGSVPTSIVSENAWTYHKAVPYVCAETNTIIMTWEYGSQLYYAYSTDRGATWSAGAEPFSNTTENGSEVGDNKLYPGGGYQFVNGLLIFNAKMKNYTSGNIEYTICSLSDPEDKVYKTPDRLFAGALSEAGLAIEAPKVRTQADGSSGGYVEIRDYGTPAKDVPKIQPDTHSHAYIKALEE